MHGLKESWFPVPEKSRKGQPSGLREKVNLVSTKKPHLGTRAEEVLETLVFEFTLDFPLRHNIPKPHMCVIAGDHLVVMKSESHRSETFMKKRCVIAPLH